MADHLSQAVKIMESAVASLKEALTVNDWRSAEGSCREVMKAAGGLYPRLSAIADYTDSALSYAEVDRALKD